MPTFANYPSLINKLKHCLASIMAFPTGDALTNRMALPNRFFDSIAAGTPVISSSEAIDLKNILEEENMVGYSVSMTHQKVLKLSFMMFKTPLDIIEFLKM